MTNLLTRINALIKLASFLLSLVLFIAALPVEGARVIDATVGETYQDFDVLNTGTPYLTGIHASPPGAQSIDGGPTDVGKLIRLAYTTPIPTQNSLTFPRTYTGTAQLIIADFDFKMTPGEERADGMGFALLNTTDYGITGTVAPIAPLFAAEEPNFTNSLGIGFDIHQAPGSPGEINNNHISIHFNGTLIQEFDATPVVDVGSAEWIHAQIIMRPGGGSSNVTVNLTPCGNATQTVVNNFSVPGFTPYENRVYFAARSGGGSADHDIDNIHVQYLNSAQAVLSLSSGCYSVVETAGTRLISVNRSGNLGGSSTIHYATTPVTATAGLDYTTVSGTLTFNAGETTKTFSVPVLDDASNEGDENFIVSLSNPSGGILGGPASAKVTIIDDEASALTGHWSTFIPTPVLPIQMHLLPNGKILFWDRHDHDLGWDGQPWLWDPASGLFSKTPSLTYDIFCSGHSFLPDGRLLITGGHIQDAVGEDKAVIYNPFTNDWTYLPNMNQGRWYPSNVTLANGDTVVVAGTYDEDLVNPYPQIWRIKSNSWVTLTTAAQSNDYLEYADYYPFLYLAPNGKVFSAGPQQVARYLDTSGTGMWTDVATSTLEYRDYGSSVMYADGKVMIVGGNPRDPDTQLPQIQPSASAEVIDLNDANPVWRTVGSMHFQRRQLNTTLLPDGKVLVTGGSSLPGFDTPEGAVLEAELWDPLSEEWTAMAAQKHYRGYHSTALLLPDGRVLVGGGGHPTPGAKAQYNFEIYSPPYLFNGARPTIASAPSTALYGRSFFVQTPNAADIQQVNLIRLSAVTHAFNQNQRISRLSFNATGNGLSVNVPSDPNLAPPGYYMLFIVSSDGVPSLAHFIQLLSRSAYLPAIANNH